MAFYQQPIMGPEDVADSEELVISCPSKRQRMDTPSRLNNLSAPDSSDAADNTTQRRKATSTHSVVAVSAANNERFCVECGATHTPQWREGPQGVHAHTCTCWLRYTVRVLDRFRPCGMVQKQHVTNSGSQTHGHTCNSTSRSLTHPYACLAAGPKTLCNACGVRYNRALQRAAKRGGALPTRPPSPCGRGRGSRARAAAAAVMEPATVTGPTRPTRQVRPKRMGYANVGWAIMRSEKGMRSDMGWSQRAGSLLNEGLALRLHQHQAHMQAVRSQICLTAVCILTPLSLPSSTLGRRCECTHHPCRLP